MYGLSAQTKTSGHYQWQIQKIRDGEAETEAEYKPRIILSYKPNHNQMNAIEVATLNPI